MDNTLERKIRKKFIVSFWITTLLFVSLFFLAGIIFVSMCGPNFLIALMGLLPLIILYWVLGWLLLNLSYKRRGTKYLLFCLGMQLITFLALALALLNVIIKFNSQFLSNDVFYFFTSLILIFGSALGYFSINCYRLYKLNRTDGKLWKEATEAVRNLSKNHENTPSEALIRKKFIRSFFVVIIFGLFNTCLISFFPLLLYKQSLLMSGSVAFGLGLALSGIWYWAIYYFGYKKKETKCLLSTIIILCMSAIFSIISLFMFYFKFESTSPFFANIAFTEIGLVFIWISTLITAYFAYCCIKLYGINFKFKKTNITLVQKMVEEKKQQASLSSL